MERYSWYFKWGTLINSNVIFPLKTHSNIYHSYAYFTYLHLLVSIKNVILYFIFIMRFACYTFIGLLYFTLSSNNEEFYIRV